MTALGSRSISCTEVHALDYKMVTHAYVARSDSDFSVDVVRFGADFTKKHKTVDQLDVCY